MLGNYPRELIGPRNRGRPHSAFGPAVPILLLPAPLVGKGTHDSGLPTQQRGRQAADSPAGMARNRGAACGGIDGRHQAEYADCITSTRYRVREQKSNHPGTVRLGYCGGQVPEIRNGSCGTSVITTIMTVDASLKGVIPISSAERNAIALDAYRWRSHSRGLYKRPAGA